MYLFLLLFLLSVGVNAQFPPAAGISGSTAIHADSTVFINWANRCYVQRGFVDIKFPEQGYVSYGTENDAIGKADNNVVSLGDGGFAIVSFQYPICNKTGFDFAVFENSFNGSFLELAFVEVSSDSIHWFRFPSFSLTPTIQQIATFDILEPEKIHNLAGKYIVMYGTPFDLDDLESNVLLDKQNVRFVKIIDVVGCIDSAFASYDSQGNIINDPYPTPFHTGGFDLDAVGIINSCTDNINNYVIENIQIYPNPACQYIEIYPKIDKAEYVIYDITGKSVIKGTVYNVIDVSFIPTGFYIIQLKTNFATLNTLFIKQ